MNPAVLSRLIMLGTPELIRKQVNFGCPEMLLGLQGYRDYAICRHHQEPVN